MTIGSHDSVTPSVASYTAKLQDSNNIDTYILLHLNYLQLLHLFLKVMDI